MARTYVKVEDAAGRVGAFLWKHRGEMMSMDDIMDGTGLTYTQVRNAEAMLKEFASRNPDKFGGWMIYIALGPSGEHGFMRETAKMVADQIARAKYMLTRTGSELSYLSQAAQRVLDPDVSRKFSRALVAYEGTSAMLEDALEKTSEAALAE